MLSELSTNDEKEFKEREEKKKILQGKETNLPFTVNALNMLVKRYIRTSHDGKVLENPEEMFMRVANTLAEVESNYGAKQVEINKYKDEFYEIMSSFKFTPAGRTIANAGWKRIVANCIVLHIEDTMESIFSTLKDAALLQQAGSGLGFPLHLLRPAGSVTKTSHGISSGPISFLHVYNNAFGVIKQQGRHGANMAVMRIDHPDILEFLECKTIEGSISNFNISVALTDEFMKQVKEDTKEAWICDFNGVKMFPREIKRDYKFSFVSATPIEITASQLFMRLIDNSWKNGEPGVIFIDTVNKTNPLPGLGRIEASNPCITADMWINTTKGPRQVKELIGKRFSIRDPTTGDLCDSTEKGFFSKGKKTIYELETKEGFVLKLTKDHKLWTDKGWKKAYEITKKDKIILDTHPVKEWQGEGIEDEGYILGELYNKFGLDTVIGEEIEKASSNFYRGFLRGFFDCNGTVDTNINNEVSIRLNQTNKPRLQIIQRMLLRLGVYSRLYHKAAIQKDKYEIIISCDAIEKYKKEIGFIRKHKKENLNYIIGTRKFTKTKFICRLKTFTKLYEQEEVFDCTIKHENHAYDAQGIVISNCSEQMLHDGDVCNLGSINLEHFVTEDRKIDHNELSRVTEIATRMLDNVIDISDFPSERVNSVARANRRIGLGIMGFADMLYKMRIGYNTQEGRDVATHVMKTIQLAAEKQSEQLSNEKGVFPNWEKSVFYPDKKRRNAALTNVAPTGAIAMMFDCSGGIEPFFSLAYYYKNILGGNIQLTYVNKHLEAALREAEVYNEELLADIIKKGTLQHRKELPEWIRSTFVTSMDISAEDHVLMQAVFQEEIDNSISKTINFLNSATKEDIYNGYMLAWEKGCKGCTVYRDGSRMEQVLNLNTSSTDNDIKNREDKKEEKRVDIDRKDICSECNKEMIRREGCMECPSCGISKCNM